MKKAIQIIVPIIMIIALLLVSCSRNDITKVDRQATAVAVTLLKTSFAVTVQTVTMEVAQNNQVVYRDTVAVVDGHFEFPTFDLEAGNATFTVHALNSSNRVVYSRSTTANIEPGRNNSISIQLLPAVPMLKLSPYWVESQTGAPFVSHVELYNIAKFHSGDFEIVFDPDVIRFDSLRSSNTAWGEMENTFSIQRTKVVVTVTRQSTNDVSPANAPALVDLWFTALTAGATELTVSTNRMVDNTGTIAELGSSQFVADGQTISIQQVSQYGTIVGTVSNAINGLPLDSVDVTVTGPSQRTARTGSDGAFSFAELPYGSYQVVASKIGFIQGTRSTQLSADSVSVDFVLTPVLDSNQYRAVLTWGQDPHDLDLHLWTLQTEIYFSHKGSLEETPYAFLDVDDQNGFGPETITLGQLLDTCKFSVYNYTGSPEITVSQAHIDLYKGASLIRSFDIPTSGTGTWWYAFDLTPTGVIIEKNVIIDYNPGQAQSGALPVKSTR